MDDSLLLLPNRDKSDSQNVELLIKRKHKKWAINNKINLSKYLRYKIEKDMKKGYVDPRVVRRARKNRMKLWDKDRYD